MDAEHEKKLREGWEKLDTAENRARAARSASWWGWLLDGLAFGFTLAAVTMACVPLLSLLPVEVRGMLVIEGWSKSLPVYGLVFAGPLWVVPRLLVDRAWKRALTWVNALPFRVDGYAEVMGDYPGSRRRSRFQLELEFEGQAPTAQALQQALEEPMVTWDVKVLGTDAQLERSPGLAEHRAETNRALFLWFQRLVVERLLPLHASSRLKAVRLVP